MTPRHIAFIMDGNGRWAENKGLARAEGYKYGLAALLEVLKVCALKHVEAVTVFAFSTENNGRPFAEKEAIFEVVKTFNENYFGEYKIRYMGDIDFLDDGLIASIEKIEERTENNDGLTLNIALNYGAKDDIIRAAKLAYDHGEFTPEAFERGLSSYGLPPLDLIVRTGGEKRLSNFMLYEAAYSELIFLDTLWPDMKSEDAEKIFEEFNRRVRKFGK